MIVWLTGQPGSGKTTLAVALASRLEADGWSAIVIDGDDLRARLPNPGYERAGRERNVDRAQTLAVFLADLGYVVIVALVSPYRAQREALKAWRRDVVEVYLHSDDPRGKGRFRTPDYEPPTGPDHVFIDTGRVGVGEALSRVRREIPTVPRRARVDDQAGNGAGPAPRARRRA